MSKLAEKNTVDSPLKKKCRIAIYARFSSDKQNPESANDQIARAKRRLNEGRVKPRRFPHDEFTYELLESWIKKDEAQSGRSTDRSGYEEILHGIRTRAFDVLLVDDLSRLTRTLGNLIGLYDLLRFHGVELYSISESLSSEDPSAKISFTVKGMVNEMGNEAHAERTKRGQEAKKNNGFSCGDLCYGYGSKPTNKVKKGSREVDSDFKTYIKPEEALVVLDIYDLYLSGKGFSSIAKYLSSKKIPASVRAQARTGKPYNWGPSGIRNILSSPKYIGLWRWSQFKTKVNPETGKKVSILQPEVEWVHHLDLKNTVDPALVIVPREKWEAVQQKLSQNKRFRASAPDPATGMRLVKTSGANCEAILSSVLRCHSCSGPLYQVSGKGGGYYGCYMHHRKDKTACSNRRLLPRVKVDKAVLDKLKQMLVDPHHLEIAASRYNQLMRERLKDAPSRGETLKARLHSINLEINNLVQFIMQSGASVPVSIRSGLADKETEKRLVVEELQVIDDMTQDKTFTTPFALKAKLEHLKTYLDKDAETGNRMMKLFFPEGLIAKPLDGEGRSKCNPYKNFWAVSGVVVISPDYRFTDLESGGRWIRIVEPYRVILKLLIQ